eukprot:ANDGO_00336.mRNA.1 hypothetical protein
MFEVIENTELFSGSLRLAAKVDIRSGRTSFREWTSKTNTDRVLFRTAVYTLRAQISVQQNGCQTAPHADRPFGLLMCAMNMRVRLKVDVIDSDTGCIVPSAIEHRGGRTAQIESVFQPSSFPFGPMVGETAPFSFGKLYSHLSRRSPHQRFRLCISAFCEVPSCYVDVHTLHHQEPSFRFAADSPTSSDAKGSSLGGCYQDVHLFSALSPQFAVKSKKPVRVFSFPPSAALDSGLEHSCRSIGTLRAYSSPLSNCHSLEELIASPAAAPISACSETAIETCNFKLSDQFLSEFWAEDWGNCQSLLRFVDLAILPTVGSATAMLANNS